MERRGDDVARRETRGSCFEKLTCPGRGKGNIQRALLPALRDGRRGNVIDNHGFRMRSTRGYNPAPRRGEELTALAKCEYASERLNERGILKFQAVAGLQVGELIAESMEGVRCESPVSESSGPG